MAGAPVLVTKPPKTLEANGAAIANNAVVQADDASYGIVADGGGYFHAKFVLTWAHGTAPIEVTTLALYARPLDISGTNDAEVPEATRPTVFVGTFVVNNVTTTQYAELIAYDVPWLASYYLHNNGTGQTVSAGWTLTAIPFAEQPEA